MVDVSPTIPLLPHPFLSPLPISMVPQCGPLVYPSSASCPVFDLADYVNNMQQPQLRYHPPHPHGFPHPHHLRENHQNSQQQPYHRFSTPVPLRYDIFSTSGYTTSKQHRLHILPRCKQQRKDTGSQSFDSTAYFLPRNHRNSDTDESQSETQTEHSELHDEIGTKNRRNSVSESVSSPDLAIEIFPNHSRENPIKAETIVSTDGLNSTQHSQTCNTINVTLSANIQSTFFQGNLSLGQNLKQSCSHLHEQSFSKSECAKSLPFRKRHFESVSKEGNSHLPEKSNSDDAANIPDTETERGRETDRSKPRFDFANLPRFVSQENERRQQVTNSDVWIISHVTSHAPPISINMLPISMTTLHRDKPKRQVRSGHNRVKKQFICRYCSREFTKSYNLLIHERTHTDERPFSCEACGKAFRRQDHLRDHKYIHSKEKPFKCAECGKGFCQARTLTVHKALHVQQLKAWVIKVVSRARHESSQATFIMNTTWKDDKIGNVKVTGRSKSSKKVSTLSLKPVS